MLISLKAIDKTTGQSLDERVDAPSADAAIEAARQRGLDNIQVSPIIGTAPSPSPVLEYHAPTVDPVAARTRVKILLLMFALELLPLAAFIVWFFWNLGSGEFMLGVMTLVAAFAFLIIQMGILAPVVRPHTGVGPAKSPWYWLSAVALGLVLGVVVVSALFLAADFYWATHKEFSDGAHGIVLLIALGLASASWLISIPLIIAFMRRGHPESIMTRIAAALFLGSAIEVVASIPIIGLAERRESCVCANASFWAIVFSIMTGSIVLGPMILLLIVARRSRAVSRGLCPVCRYDLRQLPNRDRCPQCGAGWRAPGA
jgi:hypothetical protein